MPEQNLTVVTNTTPIISLALVGKLILLERLYSEVLVPPAVYAEVLAGGKSRPGAAEINKATWIRKISLVDPGRATLLSDLDRGEAEAIALAQERNADLLILDERLARRHARRLNLTITGTLGVLLRAKEQSLINDIEPLIEQMRRGGIRLNDQLVTRVLRLAKEV